MRKGLNPGVVRRDSEDVIGVVRRDGDEYAGVLVVTLSDGNRTGGEADLVRRVGEEEKLASTESSSFCDSRSSTEGSYTVSRATVCSESSSFPLRSRISSDF